MVETSLKLRTISIFSRSIYQAKHVRSENEFRHNLHNNSQRFISSQLRCFARIVHLSAEHYKEPARSSLKKSSPWTSPLRSEKILLGTIRFHTCFGRFSPGERAFRTAPSERCFSCAERKPEHFSVSPSLGFETGLIPDISPSRRYHEMVKNESFSSSGCWQAQFCRASPHILTFSFIENFATESERR